MFQIQHSTILAIDVFVKMERDSSSRKMNLFPKRWCTWFCSIHNLSINFRSWKCSDILTLGILIQALKNMQILYSYLLLKTPRNLQLLTTKPNFDASPHPRVLSAYLKHFRKTWRVASITEEILRSSQISGVSSRQMIHFSHQLKILPIVLFQQIFHTF